jgi:hypothetical protein
MEKGIQTILETLKDDKFISGNPPELIEAIKMVLDAMHFLTENVMHMATNFTEYVDKVIDCDLFRSAPNPVSDSKESIPPTQTSAGRVSTGKSFK